MKGILHKTDKGWILRIPHSAEVEMFADGMGQELPKEAELPIHPDDIHDNDLSNGLLFDDYEGKEVEFERELHPLCANTPFGAKLILPTKRPIDYLDECIKSSPQMIKENSSIPTKASESSWDDVWKEFISDKKLRKLYSISLFDWLKQNFNPPLKR